MRQPGTPRPHGTDFRCRGHAQGQRDCGQVPQQVVVGVAALLAATRPTWRVPVLAITLLQFTLHTLNHAFDIGQAEPSWLGPANALVLGLATVALALTYAQPGNPPAVAACSRRRKTTAHSAAPAGTPAHTTPSRRRRRGVGSRGRAELPPPPRHR
jgi:hypothetical protein